MKPSWCPEIGTCRNSCHLVPLLSWQTRALLPVHAESRENPRSLNQWFCAQHLSGALHFYCFRNSAPRERKVAVSYAGAKAVCSGALEEERFKYGWEKWGQALTGGQLVRLSSRSVRDGRNSVSRSSEAKITLYWIQRWVCLSRVVTREKRTDLGYHQSRIFKEKKKTLYD